MKININHIAKLASIIMTKEDEVKLEKQLVVTLEHIERLSEIDTSKTNETNEVSHLENVLRDDEITPSLSQKDALANAKKTYKGFFAVPTILDLE